MSTGIIRKLLEFSLCELPKLSPLVCSKKHIYILFLLYFISKTGWRWDGEGHKTNLGQKETKLISQITVCYSCLMYLNLTSVIYLRTKKKKAKLTFSYNCTYHPGSIINLFAHNVNSVSN